METSSKDSSHYVSGLVTGILVGAAAVFFFGTKDGKRLAKRIAKEGDKALSDIDLLIKKLEAGRDGEIQEATVVHPKKKPSHIKTLQAKGRAAAERYFK